MNWLYANRLVSGKIVTRGYVAGLLNGAEKNERNFNLYEVDSKNLLIDGALVRSGYRLGVDNRDTVWVDLHKGLFGAVYFDSLSVRKK